ncbi:hypothetical protein MUK42_13116 [Musa troglodytarum]|uniref:Uncharacterized protein n=1 Tax=Musa troglodytarum TaxID=320322 RepID=A0A9E7L041_9LILI|nr:hypothetical protein MUK42_13116 [Musa troglodytarum]
MMSIEEEDVDVHQRDRRELRDLTRGLGELRARRPHEIRGFAEHREDEAQDMGGEGRSAQRIGGAAEAEDEDLSTSHFRDSVGRRRSLIFPNPNDTTAFIDQVGRGGGTAATIDRGGGGGKRLRVNSGGIWGRDGAVFSGGIRRAHRRQTLGGNRKILSNGAPIANWPMEKPHRGER